MIQESLVLLQRPTRLFTLVFFAIALISCAVMGIFITITLVRRRRRRLQFLQRRRTFGVEFANAPYMSVGFFILVVAAL